MNKTPETVESTEPVAWAVTWNGEFTDNIFFNESQARGVMRTLDALAPADKREIVPLYAHPLPSPQVTRGQQGWVGCNECDVSFPCNNGAARCLRLPPPEALTGSVEQKESTAQMVMVPREPTEDMLVAGVKRYEEGLFPTKQSRVSAIYRAMLAAQLRSSSK